MSTRRAFATAARRTKEALRAGNHAIVEFLLRHGAKKIELDRTERFALACIGGCRADALALLAEDPTLLEQLGHRGRVDLIHRAVAANQPDGVRFIVEPARAYQPRTASSQSR
ncbi:MAG: hypothetical protein GEU99_14325 [Luteitalea sp.]|nr:hypothetical protein [Luteitalea sp.]